MSVISLEDAFSIQQFLYREARLLDMGRYRDWLALLSESIRYEMPVREMIDPNDTSLSHDTFKMFDDDKVSLEMRVARYETGMAHAETPISVTHRMVGNIEFVDSPSTSCFLVHSNFVVNQERTRTSIGEFRGSRRDIIEKNGEDWLIRERRIILAQTILPSTISIFF